MNDTKQGETELRSLPADLGAGDPEASAGAIPNLIAGLVETETWRNAATVLMGAAADRPRLLGLYRRAHQRWPTPASRACMRCSGTVVKGLDVWIDEHMSEVQRVARDPDVVARAARLAAERRDPAAAVGRCTQEAEELSARVLSSLSTNDVAVFRIVDRGGLVLASKDPLRCGQRMRLGRFLERLDLAFEGKPQFVRPYPDREVSVASPSGTRRPVAWFLAPIRVGSGAPLAVLAMGVETDRELETIFSAARPGETAEAYAFGDDGLMLTSSRFGEQLEVRRCRCRRTTPAMGQCRFTCAIPAANSSQGSPRSSNLRRGH